MWKKDDVRTSTGFILAHDKDTLWAVVTMVMNITIECKKFID